MLSDDEEMTMPARDLFESLVEQGRMLNRTRAAYNERLEEQLAETRARALRAAQASMEKFQWRPKVSIALINHTVCQTCGAESKLFSGFGVLMRRNSDQAVRIVMTPQLDPAFPHETHYHASTTAACIHCLPSKGFTS